MDPHSLGIKGSTQPEIFQGTVDAMVQRLRQDASQFWQDALARNGPLEIWEIEGERFLANGNHRFHAAMNAGVEIPTDAVLIVDKAGSHVPTFLLEDQVWLTGFK